MIMVGGVDPTSTEGANELPYKIPDFNFDYSLVDTGVPVGFWRSVGSSYNAFFTECAIRGEKGRFIARFTRR